MTAELPIGVVLGADHPAHVIATRLNRHTFWCGQSGSGKTYALGVLLEQVMLNTALPLVILDPNSDFVRLREIRPDAPADRAAELALREIRVLHSAAGIGEQLRVRFVDMPVRSRAAILQLDPILDAEEFNTVLGIEADVRGSAGVPLVEWLRAQNDPARHRIALRLENLGIADWDLWAWGGEDVCDIIDTEPDATVVDLGGFATAAESQTAALAVLDHLWANRADRVGRLIVIDEAHNLCPADPVTPVEKLLTERIVQIAAEGRKYGLWLLLSTQRPAKVHPNALSQCDNLALMRMSSPRDLDELAGLFGYAPEDLIRRSPDFTQGQALFAGGFTAEPQVVQMGARMTREGGSDVPITLR